MKKKIESINQPIIIEEDIIYFKSPDLNIHCQREAGCMNPSRSWGLDSSGWQLGVDRCPALLPQLVLSTDPLYLSDILVTSSALTVVTLLGTSGYIQRHCLVVMTMERETGGQRRCQSPQCTGSHSKDINRAETEVGPVL